MDRLGLGALVGMGLWPDGDPSSVAADSELASTDCTLETISKLKITYETVIRKHFDSLAIGDDFVET